jgi:hypothetical protein
VDLKIGSIVYVLSGRCHFWHEWGIVDKIEGEGEATRFHLKFGKGVGSHRNPDDFWHERIDLEQHAEMPIGARADYLYGKRMCHSTSALKRPFGDGCVCMHQAHDAEPAPPAAVKRLLINGCGMACEFDVCAAHTGMEEYLYDVLPQTRRKLEGY